MNLIRRCWAPKPEDRPSFEEIYTHWKDLRADEKKFQCITESSNPWFAKSSTFDLDIQMNEETIWKERTVTFEDTDMVIRARATKFNRAQVRIKFQTTRVSLNPVSGNGPFETVMNLTSKSMLGNSLSVCQDHKIVFRHSACKQTMERFRHLVLELAKRSSSGDVDEVCALWDAPDEYGRSPISYACARGDMKRVQELLDIGSSPDALSRDHVPAISEAAMAGHVNIVKMLLSCGADPNRADVTGWTPLHMAAQSGHKDVVNVCIGARICSLIHHFFCITHSLVSKTLSGTLELHQDRTQSSGQIRFERITSCSSIRSFQCDRTIPSVLLKSKEDYGDITAGFQGCIWTNRTTCSRTKR